jgi:trafficking protein particle complex subunit 5
MAANAKKEIRLGILDRPLTKPKGEVALSSFALLFSEIVQYFQNRVTSVNDLERKFVARLLFTFYLSVSLSVSICLILSLSVSLSPVVRLEEMGYGIGKRVIELISCRDRTTKRETRIIPMLQVQNCLPFFRHLRSVLLHSI